MEMITVSLMEGFFWEADQTVSSQHVHTLSVGFSQCHSFILQIATDNWLYLYSGCDESSSQQQQSPQKSPPEQIPLSLFMPLKNGTTLPNRWAAFNIIVQ